VIVAHGSRAVPLGAGACGCGRCGTRCPRRVARYGGQAGGVARTPPAFFIPAPLYCGRASFARPFSSSRSPGLPRRRALHGAGGRHRPDPRGLRDDRAGAGAEHRHGARARARRRHPPSGGLGTWLRRRGGHRHGKDPRHPLDRGDHPAGAAQGRRREPRARSDARNAHLERRDRHDRDRAPLVRGWLDHRARHARGGRDPPDVG